MIILINFYPKYRVIVKLSLNYKNYSYTKRNFSYFYPVNIIN